jgi:hypothetical protein
MDEIMLTRIPLLLIVFTFAFVATASAQETAHSMRVDAGGGVSLIVPAIKGFRFPTEGERGVYDLVALFVSPKNRMLAALFTDRDLRLFAGGRKPKFDDYFVLQIPRSIEGRAVTLDEFQPLRRSIREQQESAQIRISPTVNRQLAEASKQTSDLTGEKIKFRVTEPIPLGVFADTERSIGMTILSMLRVDTNDGRTEDLMLSASVVTVVRGKLLYLNATCTFHSMIDLSRCNSQVNAWLSALHAANP